MQSLTLFARYATFGKVIYSPNNLFLIAYRGLTGSTLYDYTYYDQSISSLKKCETFFVPTHTALFHQFAMPMNRKESERMITEANACSYFSSLEFNITAHNMLVGLLTWGLSFSSQATTVPTMISSQQKFVSTSR